MIDENYIRSKTAMGIDVLPNPQTGAKFFLVSFTPVRIVFGDGEVQSSEVKAFIPIEKNAQTKTLVGKVMQPDIARTYLKEQAEKLMDKAVYLIQEVQDKKYLSGRKIEGLYER